MNAGGAVVIIGGGVGPMAGVALHARIIESTRAGEGDAGHLDVIHLSRSASVGDRTGYLLRGRRERENPGRAMARMIGDAARALRDGEEAVVGIPCNSFHAPEIFSAFEEDLAGLPVRALHIVRETLRLLAERLPGSEAGGGRIGVLCTTGTRMSGIYDRFLDRAGHRAVYVDPGLQADLHEAIYNNEWGIKGVSPVSARAVQAVEAVACRLAEQGVAAILPACTELPLALPGTDFRGIPLVDPVLALARGLVREAAADKLRPLV